MTAPFKLPENQFAAALKRIADEQSGAALVNDLVADRKSRPRTKIDNGEWDYDGDMGREHQDNMRDNNR
jgi:hypothetical protein